MKKEDETPQVTGHPDVANNDMQLDNIVGHDDADNDYGDGDADMGDGGFDDD